MQESIESVHRHLERSRQMQTVLRAFEARDRNLLEDNQWRVSFWSCTSLVVMLTVAFTQVYTVRRLFDDKRKVRSWEHAISRNQYASWNCVTGSALEMTPRYKFRDKSALLKDVVAAAGSKNGVFIHSYSWIAEKNCKSWAAPIFLSLLWITWQLRLLLWFKSHQWCYSW